MTNNIKHKYGRKNKRTIGRASSNIYEVNRRAKRNKLTIEKLIEVEEYEQKMIDLGYSYCFMCNSWHIMSDKSKYSKSSACNNCTRKQAKKNYKNNKKKQREYVLYKEYKITYDEYVGMKESQKYKCAICGVSEDDLDRDLAVDHDHKTGEVRGLLCGKCNRYLGQIDDDVDVAENMVAYLKTFRKMAKSK